MNELQERLKDNFFTEVKTYLKHVSSKGYVLKEEGNNKTVYKYHGEKGKFIKTMEIFELPYFVVENVPNHYMFNVNNEIINLASQILPLLKTNAYRDYLSYSKAMENIGNDKELRRELKELTKEIKNNNIPKNDKSYNDVLNQASVLNHNGVVYVNTNDFNSGYYYFHKSDNLFIKLNDDKIIKLLNNEFKVTKNKFSTLSINKYMRNDYKQLLVNSTFPIAWNEHQKALKVMTDKEKGYKEIKKITDNFI